MTNNLFVRSTTLADLARLQVLPLKARPEITRRKFVSWEVDGVQLTVEHPGGGEARHTLCASHLSEKSILVYHGCYFHPETRCRATIENLRGGSVVVRCVVSSCWYITGRVHASVLDFETPIELASFIPRERLPRRAKEAAVKEIKLQGGCLSLQASPLLEQIISHLCAKTGLTVHSMSDLGSAVDHVRKHPIELIIADSAVGDIQDFIDGLRNFGYSGRILVLSGGPDETKQYLAAGADAVLRKPFEPDGLIACVRDILADQADQGAVIGSSLLPDADLQPLIADYVQQVVTTTTEIRNATAKRDVKRVRERVTHLLESGVSFGFAELTEAARKAIDLIDESNDLGAAATALQALDLICSRLRAAPAGATQSAGQPSPPRQSASSQSPDETDS